ncbi:MAG TPA: M56 family metallopeptidase [Gemmatimonadaceae bacterium]|nr:M56 family metallopeptidase [Gemmatimonadaceae bacterium]
MIAAMMLAATCIGLLVGGAAWLLEQACVRLTLPRRWVWVLAMSTMVALPLVPGGVLGRAMWTTDLAGAGAAPSGAATAWSPFDVAATAEVEWARQPSGVPHRAPSELVSDVARTLAPLDGQLLACWALSSALLLVLAAVGARRLGRQRASWLLRQRRGLTTPDVWISHDVGPAAFGVGQGEIVIPRWAMTLPPSDRRLLLVHERSHVAAGDPRLLALAMLLVILAPWHWPLRWAYRRLQRAIEHDCDRRVLHRPTLARRYAKLLLAVAERRINADGSSMPRSHGALASISMTSFINGEPVLARRVRALVTPSVTWRGRMAALGGAVAAVMLLLVACAVPVPDATTSAPAMPLSDARITLLLNRDDDFVKRVTAASRGAWRSLGDSMYFARNDSLVIDALRKTQPELLRLAATDANYVAVALTESNEVVAHSIRAGEPPSVSRYPITAALRRSRAARRAGVQVGRDDDDAFAARLAYVADHPGTYLDTLGISLLRVGHDHLTVFWVRFKQRNGD